MESLPFFEEASEVQQALASRGLVSGPWTGDAAFDALRYAREPYERSFSRYLAGYPRHQVMWEAIRFWNRAAMAANEAFYGLEPTNIVSPARYTDQNLDSQMATTLIELAFRSVAEEGREQLTPQAFEQLLRIAAAVTQTIFIEEWGRSGLCDVRVTASSTHFSIEWTDSPRFAGAQFIAQRDDALIQEAHTLSQEGTASSLAGKMMSVAGHDDVTPRELVSFDRLVRKAFGTRLRTLLQVMHALSCHALTEPERASRVPRRDLCLGLERRFAARGEAADRGEVPAAIELLTLRRSTFAGTRFTPHRARARSVRASIRPLIHLGFGPDYRGNPDEVLGWAVWPLLDGISDYANSVIYGTWPWTLDTNDKAQRELAEALQRRKDHAGHGLGRQLEHEVSDRLARVPGLRVLEDIGTRPRPRVRGQIDVLVADEARRLLWVLSCKDMLPLLSPTNTITITRNFFGSKRKSYQAKLQGAMEDVRLDPAGFAQLVSVTEPAGRWRVRGAFVTRTLCPAAYDSRSEPSLPFLRLCDVAPYLERGGDGMVLHGRAASTNP